MKGICQCCECAYYNMKQHKCNRGCKAEPELSKDEDVRFFVDCPLPEVETVKHGEWISVDDKLPEWDKAVLVWYASNTLFGVSEEYGLSWYHGSWFLNELNGENIRIFYWQYLPEKPKGGRCEK